MVWKKGKGEGYRRRERQRGAWIFGGGTAQAVGTVRAKALWAQARTLDFIPVREETTVGGVEPMRESL